MNRKTKERIIESTLLVVGLISVAAVTLICLFLFSEGIRLFGEFSPLGFLTGTKWYPTSDPALFGLVPLFAGSIIVTAGAILFAVPLGVASAIYLSEIAGIRMRNTLKPIVEILAGIPSVVYGFFGLVVLVPYLQTGFDLPTGQTALAGSIMLGIMALPTIISISDDAIHSVPSFLKEGSLALGATRWQTIYRITVPAAISGISTAVILGIGRAIGETMTVMMVTGNAAVIPKGLLASVKTMTATIALEMGEASAGSEHYHALFAIGSVLFIFTFGINLVADHIRTKYRYKYA